MVVRVCVCACVRVCVCVCVRVWVRACNSMHVCERERERERISLHCANESVVIVCKLNPLLLILQSFLSYCKDQSVLQLSFPIPFQEQMPCLKNNDRLRLREIVIETKFLFNTLPFYFQIQLIVSSFASALSVSWQPRKMLEFWLILRMSEEPWSNGQS